MAGARAAPNTNVISDEFEQHYLHTDEDGMANPETNMDFAAAFGQDNTSAQASNQMPAPAGNGQSASDTAAAAMAQYHTMTVPEATENSFMNEPTNYNLKTNVSTEQTPSNVQQRVAVPAPFDADTSAIQSSPNGDASPTGDSSFPNISGTPKPAVGTDEWHKVRKDNHKEGINSVYPY